MLTFSPRVDIAGGVSVVVFVRPPSSEVAAPKEFNEWIES
jgi:hypothetical protein